MEDVTKLDLYALFNVPYEATENEIKKSYRKKALDCHPDKNPNDPKAAEQFHQLTKALQILIDKSARAAYDKVLKSRQAADQRYKLLDNKRRKFKDDLEQREKLAQEASQKSKDASAQLEAEIERLRKEGGRLIEEEQERLRQQLLKKKEEEEEKFQPRIKVKWKIPKGDNDNGGYSYNNLMELFSKYGKVSCLVVSNSKKGSALVEFASAQAADAAVQHEKGNKKNPLKLSWVQGKPSSTASDSRFTGFTPSSAPMSSNTSITERDYESLVLMKLRQAEERKKLIADMMKDEEGD